MKAKNLIDDYYKLTKKRDELISALKLFDHSYPNLHQGAEIFNQLDQDRAEQKWAVDVQKDNRCSVVLIYNEYRNTLKMISELENSNIEIVQDKFSGTTL